MGTQEKNSSPHFNIPKPFIYQYEDFDGILSPNVFWDAKNVHDDLLLLAPKKEQADPSEIPNLSSSNKDPDVLWNSMKNKFSRMPKDQMNYLIYFS